MNKACKYVVLVLFAFLGTPVMTEAVPTLQVGAPAGSGDVGTYADYQGSLTNPTEDDTAVTSGNQLLVAGVYKNSGVLNLGRQSGSGLDWSALVWAKVSGTDVFYPTQFNTKGAILVASVPDGQLATALASLLVGGNAAIHSDASNSWLPNPPSNHAPAKGNISDFLFFDIGNFTKNLGVVPDFAEPEGGTADGEIKTFTISGMGTLQWIHWDVMALETSTQGQTTIVTNDEGNPGSHDVTWKPSNGNGNGGGGGAVIPEPSTVILLGGGLIGLGLYGRRKIRKG